MVSDHGKYCFTIGHSNRCKEEMLKILIQYKIGYLIDVRSIPYSKYSKQYNKEPFSKFLKNNGICYKYLGNLVGGVVIAKNGIMADQLFLKILKMAKNSRKVSKSFPILLNSEKK